ncbi:MAG: sensor histidine kinase [Flavobacteriales bacterium]
MSIKTPKDVALRTSLLITLVVLALTSIALFWTSSSVNPLVLAAIAVPTFASAYLINYFSVEKFIYQKVKLIYKTIHRFKSQDSKREIKMNEDVLEEVNLDVLDWAEGKIAEITELKETDSFRKDFIGNLAHELKTPVFNIQGYILTLLEGALEDPENNRKFLKKAAKSVDRIASLIEDMDIITKIEGGKYNLEKSKFDVVELAKEVIESVERKAKNADIKLFLKNVNEKGIMVKADRSQIEQVLTNLLVNSIKYGKSDGKTIFSFYDMDDTILVELADNGIGISEGDLPRIFERFYRVDKSRNRHAGGSGLGLSIVKHIIDAHNQTINVRSTADVGSTFSFTLEKA